MALWRLVPLDLRDPSWEASSHRDFAIVRARDEADARAVAAKAFDVKTRFSPAKGHAFPPWTWASLVRAEPIEDRRYASEGPSELLEPLL
jgi:hypothetical protein